MLIPLGSCSGSCAIGCCWTRWARPRRDFLYALFTLAWVDRGGFRLRFCDSPFLLVGTIIVASMLLFEVDAAPRRPSDRNVLHLLGDQGRAVIGEMFRRLDDASAATHSAKSAASAARLGRVTQTVNILANRGHLARDIDSLVALAQEGQGTIMMACAVGDTLVEGRLCCMFTIGNAAAGGLAETRRPSQARTNLRTDPKYPIRLLVDIAIKARRRSTTRRPQSRRSTSSRTSCAVSAPRNWTRATPSTRAALCGWCSRRRPGRNLTLAFDGIRHFGSNSVQVMRQSGPPRRPRGCPAKSRAGGGGRKLFEHHDRVDR